MGAAVGKENPELHGAGSRIIANMTQPLLPRTRRHALAALATIAVMQSCASAPIDRGEATAVLDAQVARWNQGDLRGFVDTYWDGEQLTFFGRSGLVRGRKDLLATYERGYPTAKERGVLSFTVVDFVPIEHDHALLLGRYHLEREPAADGVFTLLLARQRGQVVIVHDHSTESAPPTAH